jgi:hypothetical protein
VVGLETVPAALTAAPVLAQVPPLFPPEIVDWVSKGSVALLLLYLWLRAESRLDKERDKNEALVREFVTASAKTDGTLTSILDILRTARNPS